MKQILINSEELQVRVAVVEDGTLQDFFMERNNKDRIVGWRLIVLSGNDWFGKYTDHNFGVSDYR